MSLWPELRASYRNSTGQELAKASLSAFVEHTIWYSINTPDTSYQKREALFKTIYGEHVEGADFQQESRSLYSQLDDMEAQLRQGV